MTSAFNPNWWHQIRDVMKILRRNSSLLQIAVVAVAIMLTALVGYQIKHTTDYAETATVVFTVEHSSAQVNASFRVVE
jgi:hypothetical protein